MAIAITLAACAAESEAPSSAVDQCMRRDIFTGCIEAMASVQQQQEGLAEVVLECDLSAQSQARRRIENIRKECLQ